MILIINCGGKKTPHIAGMVEKCGAKSRVVLFDSVSEQDAVSTQGIIISGSPVLLSKTGTKEYIEKLSFIKNSPVPVLGICFGHQILGALFGGNVQTDKECRVPIPITMLAKDVVFEGLPENPEFAEDHTESVSLPADFMLLASSEFCNNEAMKHKARPLYGVQFHPEVSGENGKIFLKNFCRICKTSL